MSLIFSRSFLLKIDDSNSPQVCKSPLHKPKQTSLLFIENKSPKAESSATSPTSSTILLSISSTNSDLAACSTPFAICEKKPLSSFFSVLGLFNILRIPKELQLLSQEEFKYLFWRASPENL